MFLLQQVLSVHNELIKLHGGSLGIRDIDTLKSALNRPFQYFGDIELYPSAELKAAAIIQSIIMNHPFVDGNKRVGYFLSRAVLLNYHFDIIATEDIKYEFVISVAEGKMEIEEIADWFKSHSAKAS